MKTEKKRRSGHNGDPPSEQERAAVFARAFRFARDAEPEDREEDSAGEERRSVSGQVLGAVIVTVLLVMTITLLYFIFLIEHIEVWGAERYTSSEIVEKSGVTLGAHIWLSNLGKAEALLMQDPYIKSAQIVREYPDTVRVSVVEREEMAVITGLGLAAVIDGEGSVLSIGNRVSYEGLIRVHGAGTSGYQLGEKVGMGEGFVYSTLVSMLGAIQEYELRGIIESIDISNALSIKMTTFSGYSVQVGQASDMEEKLYKLYVVLPTLESMGYRGGTLDISVRNDAVYSPPEALPGSGDSGQGDGDPDPDGPTEPDASPGPQDTPGPSQSPVPDTGTPTQ